MLQLDLRPFPMRPRKHASVTETQRTFGQRRRCLRILLRSEMPRTSIRGSKYGRHSLWDFTVADVNSCLCSAHRSLCPVLRGQDWKVQSQSVWGFVTRTACACSLRAPGSNLLLHFLVLCDLGQIPSPPRAPGSTAQRYRFCMRPSQSSYQDWNWHGQST